MTLEMGCCLYQKKKFQCSITKKKFKEELPWSSNDYFWVDKFWPAAMGRFDNLGSVQISISHLLYLFSNFYIAQLKEYKTASSKLLSMKPKFGEWFFVNLRVLYNLCTWNCSSSSAHQNKNKWTKNRSSNLIGETMDLHLVFSKLDDSNIIQGNQNMFSRNSSTSNIKFSFSEKATEICNHEDDCAHFCGLLRKAEL